MAPKQQVIRNGRISLVEEKGYARQVVDEIASSENRQVITAVGLFVVSNQVAG